MKLYKMRIKPLIGGRILDVGFEAEDISKAEELSDRYCKSQGFQKIRLCPFIFDIKSFLEIVDNDPGRYMDTPEMFGINIERKELLEQRRAKELDGTIVEKSESKKVAAVK